MTDITPSLADAITVAQLNVRLAQTSAEAAVEAAADASQAATAVFSNFFYGILSADPSTRPDLSASQDGDLYYNSTSAALKMRVSGAWSAVAVSVTMNALVASQNLSDLSSVSQARTNLGLGSAALLTAAAANGAATLGSDGKVPSAQLPSSGSGYLVATNNLSDLTNATTARSNLLLGTAATKNAGGASGVADLDSGTKVPVAQLPAGTANGVASLDANARVPKLQLWAGISNGMAELDGGGKVPTAQLPAFGDPTTVAKSGDYVTIAGDSGKCVFVTTGSSADVTITLVAANTAGDGATMIIAKADSGTKKVIVEDSDGSTQIAWLSNQFDTVCFRSNGSAWSIFWHKIAPRVDVYIANDTWTKPPLAKFVYVDIIGPGGGGGSGARDTSGNLFGGGGGGGGARNIAWFRIADLSTTESLVVPAGGNGGAARATTNDGLFGDNANTTTFGTTVKLQAGGGTGGAAGLRGTTPPVGNTGGSHWSIAAASAAAGSFEGSGAASGGGSAGLCANYGGASTGISSLTATAGAGGSSIFGGAAGGAGGGYQAAARAGGAGGKTGSYTAGGGGNGGSAGNAGSPGSVFGVAGGGGGCSVTTGTSTGGEGGVGAGGGGGGGALNTTSGAGGAGGRGEATVMTVFA